MLWVSRTAQYNKFDKHPGGSQGHNSVRICSSVLSHSGIQEHLLNLELNPWLVICITFVAVQISLGPTEIQEKHLLISDTSFVHTRWDANFRITGAREWNTGLKRVKCHVLFCWRIFSSYRCKSIFIESILYSIRQEMSHFIFYFTYLLSLLIRREGGVLGHASTLRSPGENALVFSAVIAS